MQFFEEADERGPFLRVVCSNGEFVMDIPDHGMLGGHTWCILRMSATNHYVGRSDRKTKTTILLHRVLMNAAKGEQVDHRDGDGLNDRGYNLRNATQAQNKSSPHNRRMGDVPLRGVSRLPKGRYTAILSHLGKLTHLGTFNTAEDAARAWDKAALAARGEFARLNFPT